MKETLRALMPQLSELQLARFETYYAMLVDWNSRMNLTAITEKSEVAKKHFYDSMQAAALIPGGARCIDVGTGAGFPGVPLLILRPDLELTLLDSLNKRLIFLKELLEALGLSASLVHARAEDAGRDPAHREQYDIALSRAVSALPCLLELTSPFLKVGGRGIACKGEAREELLAAARAAKLLNLTLSSKDIPADYGARSLVFYDKTGRTPSAYPRKAGTPAKKPL